MSRLADAVFLIPRGHPAPSSRRPGKSTAAKLLPPDCPSFYSFEVLARPDVWEVKLSDAKHIEIGGNRRNLQLDCLRGVAILMVIMCHSVLFRLPYWDWRLVLSGWAGVDLFFVLSGFLISGLLFAEYRRGGTIRFRRFAIRRALKIYPAFYALVLLTVCLNLMSSD